MQSNNIQTTGEGGGVKIVESRNMLEETDSGEEMGEGKEVTNSLSSMSEEGGAAEIERAKRSQIVCQVCLKKGVQQR